MLIKTVYKSTFSVFDLSDMLKTKKLLFSFGVFLVDCPIHFIL